MKYKLIISILSVLCISSNILADILHSSAQGIDDRYGYGGANWSKMSDKMDAGGLNLTSVLNLENTTQVMTADALWIDQRSSQLSAAEVSNIQSFINTGKRVVIFGENHFWGDWNTQILNIVGGNFEGDSGGTFSKELSHELTDGAPWINAVSCGTSSGGKDVFSDGVVSLFGSNDNALVILDVNMFDDFYVNTENQFFANNLIDWVAVPEPSSIALMSLVGSAGWLVRRRIRIM